MLKCELSNKFVDFAFDLFTSKLHKDREFFSELRELEISYTTLLEILDDFIKTKATDKQKEKYLYAKDHSTMSPIYAYYYKRKKILKKYFIESAKVNFDKDLMYEIAQKEEYTFKYFLHLIVSYVTLFATEEEYMQYLKYKKKDEQINVGEYKWDTVIKTILEKNIDDAIKYIKELDLNYNTFCGYMCSFKCRNPFCLTQEDLESKYNYLSTIRKICYEDQIHRKTKDKSYYDKDKAAIDRLENLYFQYRDLVQEYVDNKILVGNLSPKNILEYKCFNDLIKAVSIFDKDLYEKYIEKCGREKDNNHISDICLQISTCLENGINVNGQKDSFSIFDYLLLTDIKISTFYNLMKPDSRLTNEQFKEIKRFLSQNLGLRIIVDPEKIISEKILFIHNGEELTPSVEDKRYVMDYILSKNIFYVSAYKVALRRYTKYGVINEDVIPFEEPSQLFELKIDSNNN